MQAGHLVYAKGESDDTIYEIHGTDVRIFTHSLDLEAQPLELLGQIGRLAAKVVKHSNIKAE
jgi:hypothetical protein